ncbi:beta-glucan synthesis-associated [Panaeolus papilionaceus]|nr:beta-glucan synthesis-associated [Panaeolus papilionaceus]
MSFSNETPILKDESSGWTDFATLDSTPYPAGYRSSLATISSLYPASRASHHKWTSLSSAEALHDEDDEFGLPYTKPGVNDTSGTAFPLRGFKNTGCLSLLIACILALFIGYPIISSIAGPPIILNSPYNIGHTNASGQVPQITGNWGLIDVDTPREAYTKTSWTDGQTEMELVFSDEFNTEGRTFYPGDDPYWEAADLHYWATNNLEWYDPEAITTKGGALVITLSAKETHGLNYEGGMLTTWNKFCFTGGYFEASVQLPGSNDVAGLWPAVWAMGNLGRAGYGATTDGVWPYTYDSCDVGTAPNQTHNGLPLAATADGRDDGEALSFLPGQRLSRCTCSGEDHPGPKHKDGTFVGRAAPEIDVFEAQISKKLVPEVSQSAQWAPFNADYHWTNTSDNFVVYDASTTQLNSYVGGNTQQASSYISLTDSNCYELDGGCFSVYGFEYKPGFDNAYITWISNNKATWTIRSDGLGPDSAVGISARPVPQEPMYLIANLGISTGFGPVDVAGLAPQFPVHMRIDYIRVYQPKGSINVGCSPDDFPTAAYIEKHIDAYSNPNFTTWVDDYRHPWPKSSFLGQC